MGFIPADLWKPQAFQELPGLSLLLLAGNKRHTEIGALS